MHGGKFPGGPRENSAPMPGNFPPSSWWGETLPGGRAFDDAESVTIAPAPACRRHSTEVSDSSGPCSLALVSRYLVDGNAKALREYRESPLVLLLDFAALDAGDLLGGEAGE